MKGYLLNPHSSECAMFNGQNEWNPWCLPEGDFITPPKRKRRIWVKVFKCCDPACDGRMAIKDTDYNRIMEAALKPFRNLGKPRGATPSHSGENGK